MLSTELCLGFSCGSSYVNKIFRPSHISTVQLTENLNLRIHYRFILTELKTPFFTTRTLSLDIALKLKLPLMVLAAVSK